MNFKIFATPLIMINFLFNPMNNNLFAVESGWGSSANIGIFSDYRFRGVKQTEDAPAIQGGFDLLHSSGFYIGNWNSNVEFAGTSLEMDFYGGYSFEVGDINIDLGDLYYYYPDKVGDDVNSNEIYAIATYGHISLGLHYFTTDWYGAPDSDGTTYTQINFEYPVSDKMTVIAHVGTHSVENSSESDYKDYRLSIAYDVGDGYEAGLDFIDNSGDGCTGNVCTSGAVISFSKSF
jgi:uncharacterized protein (TIGR02001 family)